MDKQSLELLLGQGLSIERIAKRFGKDPSTISYWMKKHGLASPYADKHAARGGIERDQLEALVETGASIGTISQTLRRSPATVRRWLTRYGLETRRSASRRAAQQARNAGQLTFERHCPQHGVTKFILEGRGGYRCARCRQEAVARRRRKVKEILIEEAGGACRLCGYNTWAGALEFHHVDPSQKGFSISSTGVTRSLDRARVEARKCVLLCSNCHAEVEGGVANVPLEFPLRE